MDFLADEAQALKPLQNNQEQTEVHLFRLSQCLVWQITVKNKPDKTLKPMNTKNFIQKWVIHTPVLCLKLHSPSYVF